MNAGYVEAAAMSGLGAASALSGVHIPIISTTPEPRTTDAYIDYAGWITLPPAPAVGNDTTFYSFAFAANGGACQDFLDRSYNRAAGYQRFRVMLDTVILNIVQSRHTAAVTPPFSSQGTMAEADIGFWLLVGNYEPGGLLPKSIGLIPAYLFVDNAWAVAEGREVWGFPKYFAAMTLPDGQPPSTGIFEWGPFAASALAIARFSPAAQASVQQVLKLRGTVLRSEEMDLGPAGARVDIFKRLFAGADKDRLNDLCGKPGMPPFLSAAFPVFYLKQVRSAESPTTASYKALLEGALELTRVDKIGLLPGIWTLELGQFDSLPLISDLGLGTPTNGKLVLTTPIGFWAEIDFATSVARPMT